MKFYVFNKSLCPHYYESREVMRRLKYHARRNEWDEVEYLIAYYMITVYNV